MENFLIMLKLPKIFNPWNCLKKTGPLLACFPVTSEDGLVMMTKDGQTIRIPIEGIRKASRTTQGVKLVKLEDGKTITTVAKVPAPEDDDEGEMEE